MAIPLLHTLPQLSSKGSATLALHLPHTRRAVEMPNQSPTTLRERG